MKYILTFPAIVATFISSSIMIGSFHILSAEAAATPPSALKMTHITDFKARLPIHSYGATSTSPKGLTPALVKSAYGLPRSGGSGTIALVEAYAHPEIESDLAVFDKQFGLAACTTKNNCLEVHPMSGVAKEDSGWALETALDVEWAHGVAPNAKILLVESKSDSGTDLLSAVDYARKRSDVVAVSMSWGGPEFSDETKYDSHFASPLMTNSTSSSTTASSTVPKITFFAASGDNGSGVNWPAASPNVVGVGGTTLTLKNGGIFGSETAWQGSGGGVSQYESRPHYQTSYDILKASGMRAVPDVAYNADPHTGYSVYHFKAASSVSKISSKGPVPDSKGWYIVGGTSAGAPQWAAIKALGNSASNEKFYTDKASDKNGQFFRDITEGSNGTCAYYCAARKHYDYVTGLGSPLTDTF